MRRIGVLPTIDLNDEPSFNRTEVREVRADRKLAAKLYVAHPPSSQMTPKNLFSGRLLAAQFAGRLVGRF
jgi:hypothetical protein